MTMGPGQLPNIKSSPDQAKLTNHNLKQLELDEAFENMEDKKQGKQYPSIMPTMAYKMPSIIDIPERMMNL